MRRGGSSPTGAGKRAKRGRRAPALPSTPRPATAPDEVAEAAVAHGAQPDPSAPGKVRLTLTIALRRSQAEQLTARAIREGRNLEALVADILEAAPTDGD